MERFILKKLLDWKDSPYRKPLILKGVRQVGKTWILKEFGRRCYENTAYFNFDENEEYKQFFETTKDVDRILQNLMLASGQKIVPEKTLIIFDEVQDCPKVINSMKYFCENAPQYHVACAGSLLGIALAKPSSFPVGKVNFMQIDPMTFAEFLLANGDENLAQYLESQVQVSVYMQDSASAEELQAVEAKLKMMPGVVKVMPVSKQQALARFKERLGDQEQLLNSLGKENPFPNSFEVQVDNPERIKVITPSIGQLPKVETAKFGQEVVEHLFSLTKILRFGGIVLVIFLAMATLFIISNTIRLTVFARRKEVVIMKYVGATDWFIRWPFLLEGMTLGFFGAVIASVCINSLYAGLLERIHATLAFLPLLPTSPLLFYVTIFLLAAGTGIGALGSYISLRKFLRV